MNKTVNVAVRVSSTGGAKLYLDVGLVEGVLSKKDVCDAVVGKFNNSRPLIYDLNVGEIGVLSVNNIVPRPGDKPYAACLGHWWTTGDINEAFKSILSKGKAKIGLGVASCPALIFATSVAHAKQKALAMCEETWPHSGFMSGNQVKVKLIPARLYK